MKINEKIKKNLRVALSKPFIVAFTIPMAKLVNAPGERGTDFTLIFQVKPPSCCGH